jgi:hypothetical protein
MHLHLTPTSLHLTPTRWLQAVTVARRSASTAHRRYSLVAAAAERSGARAAAQLALLAQVEVSP